jgi:hypothetical protein
MILNKTILGVCLLAMTGLAFCETDAPKSRIYVGTHAQMRYTDFDKKFGKAIMRKKHHQGHIFVGFKLNDNFAIEVGREGMVSKLNHTILSEGQMFNGIPIPKEFAPSEFVTNMQLKSMNLDMVYYMRLFDDIPLSFVPSIGISHITVDITRDTLQCGTFSNKIPSRIFNKSFLALKPSAALQFDCDNGFSLRTSVSFINTNGTKMKTKDSHTFKLRSKPRVNLKDSCVIGVGFVVNL